LRFAISGHAPKVEAKEPIREPAPETKPPASETAEAADATDNETKIKAATGG
jgi:two-component system, NtrC family, nitrogen regulation sensor histidine kinase NtrY